jgi:hypothetical protein
MSQESRHIPYYERLNEKSGRRIIRLQKLSAVLFLLMWVEILGPDFIGVDVSFRIWVAAIGLTYFGATATGLAVIWQAKRVHDKRGMWFGIIASLLPSALILLLVWAMISALGMIV